MHTARTAGRARAVLVAAAVLCATVISPSPDAGAVSASFWRTDSFDAAEAGRLAGTSLLNDGRVVLAPEIIEVGAVDAQYAWTGHALPNGNVVVVVGTPGRVLLLADGRARELFSLDTGDVTAMAVSDAGEVFVGTAPGGEVYLVGEDGESSLFFESGEGYVWSLAHSPEHGLLVGTGDAARVYAVDARGDGNVIYESAESSVSVLAASGGRVLAGTSLDGLVLDVTPGEDLRVLRDTGYDEITGIALGEDGTVCFSAASVSLEDVLEDGNGYGAGFGSGGVYRITPTGGSVELWHSPDAPVTSLGLSPDGAVLAGVGAGGLIYAVKEGGVDLIADLDAEEVLSIGGTDDVIVTVGAPAGVYRIGDSPADSGEYESDVLDARSTAKWGELSWSADLPGGAGVELFARSGNTQDPDETWSDWSRVSGSSGGQITCPPARFLPWKALLRRGSRGPGPSLLSVEAAYLRENLPPIVAGVTVHDPGDVATGGAGDLYEPSVSQTLPGGLEVTYSLDPGAPAGAGLPVLLRGLRTASWEALDPNGDALEFDVYLKADDEEDWKRIAERIFGRSLHTWDTVSMTDGSYRLRVTATDVRSNPAESALEASSVSPPFVVDHTPPEFSDLEVGSGSGVLTVRGRVEDALSQVTFVDVSVDYGPWRPAFAADGMFDSRGEAFELVIEDAGPGEHTVSVRAADRSGNPAVERRLSR
jgi:hypothetical protein